MSESEQKAHQCPSGAVGWDERLQDEITSKRVNSSYSPSLLLMPDHNNDKLRSQTHVSFVPLRWQILGNLTVKDWFSVEQGKPLPLLFEVTVVLAIREGNRGFPASQFCKCLRCLLNPRILLVQNLNNKKHSCSNGVVQYL